MTLYVGATDRDDDEGSALLSELLGEPSGAAEAIEGLESLCAALLILLELESRIPPDVALQRIATMVSQPRSGHGHSRMAT
jgi:hypothetical protein